MSYEQSQRKSLGGDAPAPAWADAYPQVEDVPSRRSTIMSLTGLMTSILIAELSVVPSPYAIGEPGPTFDTLGAIQEVELVSVEGAPTYEGTGELRLTTVSVSPGSSRTFTLGPVLHGWFSPSRYVVPEEYVFGDPDDQEEFDEQAHQAWVSSQESAAVSALDSLGVKVPATLRVAAIDETSHALGVLETDDVIIAVNGTEVESFGDLALVLEEYDAGDEITLTVLRDDAQSTHSFLTIDDGTGEAIMGIWIDPIFDLPIDVTVQIDSVGGPSAGLMFSLGIMDKLTAEDELDGALVAGTGAITADGDVQPIGGIQLKMIGAFQDGARYFLAPVENCPEVRGRIPEGLEVFAVDTLDDAYAAIVAIGERDTAHLPTC